MNRPCLLWIGFEKQRRGLAGGNSSGTGSILPTPRSTRLSFNPSRPLISRPQSIQVWPHIKSKTSWSMKEGTTGIFGLKPFRRTRCEARSASCGLVVCWPENSEKRPDPIAGSRMVNQHLAPGRRWRESSVQTSCLSRCIGPFLPHHSVLSFALIPGRGRGCMLRRNATQLCTSLHCVLSTTASKECNAK